MKPKLYIGLEGVVLVHGRNPDPFLGYEIVPFAKSFLHWATQHFDVCWLTDLGARHAFYVNDQLGLRPSAVPVCGFNDSKVEQLDPSDDFYWIEDDLIPSEVAWLAQHGLANRLIQVDTVKGITPENKAKLEGLLRRK